MNEKARLYDCFIHNAVNSILLKSTFLKKKFYTSIIDRGVKYSYKIVIF